MLGLTWLHMTFRLGSSATALPTFGFLSEEAREARAVSPLPLGGCCRDALGPSPTRKGLLLAIPIVCLEGLFAVLTRRCGGVSERNIAWKVCVCAGVSRAATLWRETVFSTASQMLALSRL